MYKTRESYRKRCKSIKGLQQNYNGRFGKPDLDPDAMPTTSLH